MARAASDHVKEISVCVHVINENEPWHYLIDLGDDRNVALCRLCYAFIESDITKDLLLNMAIGVTKATNG